LAINFSNELHQHAAGGVPEKGKKQEAAEVTAKKG